MAILTGYKCKHDYKLKFFCISKGLGIAIGLGVSDSVWLCVSVTARLRVRENNCH